MGSRALGAKPGDPANHRTTVRLTEAEWRLIEGAAFKAGVGIGRFLAVSGTLAANSGVEVDLVPVIGDPTGRGPVQEVLRVGFGVSGAVFLAPASGPSAPAGTVFLVRTAARWRVLVVQVDRRRWVGSWSPLRPQAEARATAELKRLG